MAMTWACAMADAAESVVFAVARARAVDKMSSVVIKLGTRGLVIGLPEQAVPRPGRDRMDISAVATNGVVSVPFTCSTRGFLLLRREGFCSCNRPRLRRVTGAVLGWKGCDSCRDRGDSDRSRCSAGPGCHPSAASLEARRAEFPNCRVGMIDISNGSPAAFVSAQPATQRLPFCMLL